MNKKCTYCGVTVKKPTKDHVIPACLYPKRASSTTQVERMTVPACTQCNNGWSDDEAHFRNVLMLAGESNDAVKQLFSTKVRRSFQQIDGKKRRADLDKIIRLVAHEGKQREKIYPADDPRVCRVLRKIVRGLCGHHEAGAAVAESRVFVDILRFPIPDGILEAMTADHRDQRIFDYRYQIYNDGVDNIHSAWLVRFFERTTFIAIVSASEDGFGR